MNYVKFIKGRSFKEKEIKEEEHTNIVRFNTKKYSLADVVAFVNAGNLDILSLSVNIKEKCLVLKVK